MLPNTEDEAVVKAIKFLDSLEWSDWIQLLCNPDVQSLLAALGRRSGCEEALETADLTLFCFAVIRRLCFGRFGPEFIELEVFSVMTVMIDAIFLALM